MNATRRLFSLAFSSRWHLPGPDRPVPAALAPIFSGMFRGCGRGTYADLKQAASPLVFAAQAQMLPQNSESSNKFLTLGRS